MTAFGKVIGIYTNARVHRFTMAQPELADLLLAGFQIFVRAGGSSQVVANSYNDGSNEGNC